MGQSTWASLRNLLISHYDDFRTRLARRLGSDDLARESLNETWLRLHRKDEIGAVQSPAEYVLRMAINIATDGHRKDSRRLRRTERLEALEIADPTPDPARQAEARLELEALNQAIAALPDRTREVLLAARLEGLPQQEIADRFGITTRMVRFELRRALDHCEAHLERLSSSGFPSQFSEISVEKPGESVPVPASSEKDDAT